ncbi:MAG: TIGR04084 family radical SAM/SPASM domain-containing protein [Crenarchaeota archaeon]|nr:TIGR04084 family radical SAM/SPASM domain-containing protein [Thermoproteota archaeon]
MLWFIITTWRCNLNCKYCGNEPRPYGEPSRISYDLQELKTFISQDPEPIIAFYGGEPLLSAEIIEWILDNIPAKHYVLQTNGLLIRKLRPSYLNRLDTILVSIDGRQSVTDYYRGKGVYKAVVSNVKYLREIGYRGDIIARMTVSGKSDIYADVRHLIDLGLFDHIHWQLDVFFDAPPHQRYADFQSWLEKYVRGLDALINFWLQELSKGRLIGIVPFQGLLKILVLGDTPKPPCGAGQSAFAISTSGKIFACPVSPSDDFLVGHIKWSKPADLAGKMTIGSPCTECEFYTSCGGRCLYAKTTMLWGEDLFFRVCSVTKYLISRLRGLIPRIQELVSSGVISWDSLLYPPFNNTTEIIP